MINIKEFRVDKLILLITKIRAMITNKETTKLIPHEKRPEFLKIFQAVRSFRDNPQVYKELLRDEELMGNLSTIFERDDFKMLYEDTLIYRNELATKWEKFKPIIKDYCINTLGMIDEKDVIVNVVNRSCITGTNDMQNEIFWGHNFGEKDASYDITYIMHEAMHCKYPREKEWSDEQYGVFHSLMELAIDNELMNRLGGNNHNYARGHKDGKSIRKKLMPLWITFLSRKGGALEFETPKDEEFKKYMKLAQRNNVQNMNFTELMNYCIEHYQEYGLDENTFKVERKNEKSDVGDER